MVEFVSFVRKPFVVEAVEITLENIEELAAQIGTLAQKADGTPYIQVDRRLVPSVFRVYPGFFMTKMDGNVRCYSPKVFSEQFLKADPVIMSWVEYIDPSEEKTEVVSGPA